MRPGELIWVPDRWWHATCNLAPWTIGVGSQGWLPGVPHFSTLPPAAAAAMANNASALAGMSDVELGKRVGAQKLSALDIAAKAGNLAAARVLINRGLTSDLRSALASAESRNRSRIVDLLKKLVPDASGPAADLGYPHNVKPETPARGARRTAGMRAAGDQEGGGGGKQRRRKGKGRGGAPRSAGGSGGRNDLTVQQDLGDVQQGYTVERLAALLEAAVAHGLVPRRRIGAIKKKIRAGKRTVRWFVERWEKKLREAGIEASGIGGDDGAARPTGTGRHAPRNTATARAIRAAGGGVDAYGTMAARTGADEGDRYGDAGERASFMTKQGTPNRVFEYEAYGGQQAWGQCDLESVRHADVTQAWLLAQTRPVVIKGATKGWAAYEKWSLDNLLNVYGDDSFYPKGIPGVNETVAEVLRHEPWGGAMYHMGHMKRRGDCYRGDMEPYTPFLGTRMAGDFKVPGYFLPMGLFQMGMGQGGKGLGVPPEAHQMSWFAQIQGRKRWVLNAPNVQKPEAALGRTSRSGADACAIGDVTTEALRCDVEAGDILWLPTFWWHETCGLDDFNVGFGGLTEEASAHGGPREGTCSAEERATSQHYGPGMAMHRVEDIEACTSGNMAGMCPTLNDLERPGGVLYKDPADTADERAKDERRYRQYAVADESGYDPSFTAMGGGNDSGGEDVYSASSEASGGSARPLETWEEVDGYGHEGGEGGEGSVSPSARRGRARAKRQRELQQQQFEADHFDQKYDNFQPPGEDFMTYPAREAWDDAHGADADDGWVYDPFTGDREWGACDIETVRHEDVTREWVLARKTPFIVKGATDDWLAHEKWGLADMLADHGDAPFYVRADGPDANISLSDLLANRGKYNMGHLLRDGDCYKERYRPYSPFLRTRIGGDYKVPKYFSPMSTFQIGIGTGPGIGVPPEQHPGAWFAQIKGRKRWILVPRSTNPPREVMSRGGDRRGRRNLPDHEKCQPSHTARGTMRCDVQMGDIIWVPSFWWHETCGLDQYNVGPVVETLSPNALKRTLNAAACHTYMARDLSLSRGVWSNRYRTQVRRHHGPDRAQPDTPVHRAQPSK